MSTPIVTPTPETVETPTLETSIQNAVETTAQPETPVTTDPPAESTPVETPTPQIDANTQRAVDFYNALSDPNTAPAVLEFLAKQSGFELKKPEAPAQPAQPKITDLISKELGDDYAFLAPKLGTALETVLNNVLQPLQQQLLQTQITNEYNTAVSELRGQHQDFASLENDIATAMKKFKPADGVSLKEYMSDMYSMVKAKKSPSTTSATVQTVVNKIAQNAQETLPSPSAATENRVIKGPANPTIEEAIAAALNGQSFG